MMNKNKFLLVITSMIVLTALFASGLSWYFNFQQASSLKEIDQLIKTKHYAEAIERSIELFQLDKSNCSQIVLEHIDKRNSNGEEVVAQTNFDQVVRLDSKRDAFHSANRLVLTLFHEFIHCNQHQRLYEYVRKSNINLRERLKNYDQLKTFSMAVESVGSTTISEHKETEEILLQVLSPLAKYLENAFEIDALIQVLQLKNLIPEGSEEFNFHMEYLRAALQLVNQQDRSVCEYEKDIVDEIALPYKRSCVAALSFVKKYSMSPLTK